MDPRLTALAERYRPVATSPEDLPRLATRYARERETTSIARETTFIDAVAAGCAVESLFAAGHINWDALTPQMREAFSLAYPGVDLSSLEGLSGESLRGFLAGWKGKLFEVVVRDRLNAGQWVGDVHLDHGQVAVLAGSPNQPGWDLQFLDQHGHVVEQLQLKATDHFEHVREALKRYPGIDVLAAGGTDHAGVGHLHVSDISNDALNDRVHAVVGNILQSKAEIVLEQVGHFLPFLVIAGTEGRRYIIGKQTFETTAAAILRRSGRSAAVMGLGLMLLKLGLGEPVTISSAFLARFAIGRYDLLRSVDARLQAQTDALRVLRGAYGGVAWVRG